MAELKSASQKILLMAQGSRGDVQPYVALGLALQQAGYVVNIGTNVDLVAFVKNFDLEATEIAYDMSAIMDSKDCREAVATGNLTKFGDMLANANKGNASKYFAIKCELFQSFKPDVVVITLLDMYDCIPLANYFGIPVVTGFLYSMWPTKHLTSDIGEPCLHRLVGTFLQKMTHGGERDGKAEAMLSRMPEIRPHMIQNLREWMLTFNHPIAPALMGCSPCLFRKQDDWPQELKDLVHMTGFWIVDKEAQTRQVKKGDEQFGGSSLDALTDFLGKGDAPVYMGWGSMIAVSGEHMTCLAVRSLMKSQSRGIIVGGWAKLEAGMMHGQPDTPQMVEYARENVLFVKAAPHEWLFPQCACTVHHGGSGTMAAALRAGKPTIITPCFGDQFANAAAVNQSGAGIGMKQFSKVTVGDLAHAISKVKTPPVLEAASDIGERLQAEDGLGNAVKILDTWMAEEVVTGKYKEKREAQAKMVQRMRAQRDPSCFWWLGRLCCLGEAANNYKL